MSWFAQDFLPLDWECFWSFWIVWSANVRKTILKNMYSVSWPVHGPAIVWSVTSKLVCWLHATIDGPNHSTRILQIARIIYPILIRLWHRILAKLWHQLRHKVSYEIWIKKILLMRVRYYVGVGHSIPIHKCVNKVVFILWVSLNVGTLQKLYNLQYYF